MSHEQVDGVGTYVVCVMDSFIASEIFSILIH
jgi:hypothetical protein